MSTSTLWTKIHHRDVRARMMADRHYSRRTPGAPEFIPAGHKIVLMHFLPDGTPAALWASHRPAPGKAGRMDGLDVWDCSLFRVEHKTVPASMLILEAMSITKALWGAVMPVDGFYTTINPRKVPPIKRRGVDMWGYSWIKAGWREAGRTKVRDLLVFLYDYAQLVQLPCIIPQCEMQQEVLAL